MDRPPQFLSVLVGQLRKVVPDVSACRVQFNLFARLGVLDGEESDIGQFPFPGIVDGNGNHIVVPVGYLEFWPEAFK